MLLQLFKPQLRFGQQGVLSEHSSYCMELKSILGLQDATWIFFRGDHSQCGPGCHHPATGALSPGVALSQGLRMLGSETHPKSQPYTWRHLYLLTWVLWHHSSNSSPLRHWTPAVLQEGLNTHLYGIRDATPTSSDLRSWPSSGLWSFESLAPSDLFRKQLV